MSAVQICEVEPGEAGQRLDRWFRRRFPQLAHGRLEKLLRTGQVRVDGARARAGLRLSAGQQVRVPPLPEAAERPAPRPAYAPRPQDAAMLRQAVLHRDDAVLAIDKPAGLAVQGGSGTPRHLDAMLEALRFGARERPRLVHRLDKDTSGVLLLGRTPAAAAALAAAFRERAAEKVYWAIVRGVPRPRSGRMAAALRKGGGRGRERVQVDAEAGQPAVTDYAVLETVLRQAAWLELRPRTGRTHQLRAHCAALGTPILGDGKYGGAEAFISGLELDRKLHLHARSIALSHPDGGLLQVEAPLPAHFARTMAALGLDPAGYRDPFADPGAAMAGGRRQNRNRQHGEEYRMPHVESSDGTRLYYEEAGEGRPIVFVHEFAGDLRSWEPQLRYFARRYRCVAYNARGYPPSDVPGDGGAYSQDIATDDVAAVIRGLELGRAHVVGCSMGGFATLHFGLRYPELAHSLVVVGCGYGARKDGRAQFQQEAEAFAADFESRGMADVAAAYSVGPTRVQFQNKDPRGFAEFRQQFAEHSAKGSGLTLANVQARRPSLYDLEDRLKALEVPTLLVTGDEDEPCLDANLFLKRSIASAGLLMLPRTGHAANLEEPEAFNHAVQEFLASVDAGRWASRDPRSISASALTSRS